MQKQNFMTRSVLYKSFYHYRNISNIKTSRGILSTFPSVSSLSSPTDAILRLRGIANSGDAPNIVGLLKFGWACGVWDSLLCGVFSTERSCEPPPGVGPCAGVPPFCNGVLGGKFLSKNSGERGTPKRTVFFLFLTADFFVGSSSPAKTTTHLPFVALFTQLIKRQSNGTYGCYNLLEHVFLGVLSAFG